MWASLIGPGECRLERGRRRARPPPAVPGPARPRAAEQKQRAVVGGLLDDDPVARPEQVLEEHRARLERAVGDHHLRGRRSHRGARRSTRRGPDARSRSRRRVPFPSRRRAPAQPPRAPPRGAGCRRSARLSQTKSFRQPWLPTLPKPRSPPTPGVHEASDPCRVSDKSQPLPWQATASIPGANPPVSELRGANEPSTSETPTVRRYPGGSTTEEARSGAAGLGVGKQPARGRGSPTADGDWGK